jgi:hypothetical protein
MNSKIPAKQRKQHLLALLIALVGRRAVLRLLHPTLKRIKIQQEQKEHICKSTDTARSSMSAPFPELSEGPFPSLVMTRKRLRGDQGLPMPQLKGVL